MSIHPVDRLIYSHNTQLSLRRVPLERRGPESSGYQSGNDPEITCFMDRCQLLTRLPRHSFHFVPRNDIFFKRFLFSILHIIFWPFAVSPNVRECSPHIHRADPVSKHRDQTGQNRNASGPPDPGCEAVLLAQ